MARIRAIHPDSLAHVAVVSLSHPAADLWFRLRVFVDDRGVCPADPIQLAIRCYPGRTPDAGLERVLRELEQAELVVRFGGGWLMLPGWREPSHPNYQRIDRPSPSSYPEPPRVVSKPHPQLSLVADEGAG